MDFLNKKSWHPGSFKNRKKVYLAEEQQRESEKKHKALLEEYKAEAVCDCQTTDTRVAFLYSAPPGLHPGITTSSRTSAATMATTTTREKVDDGGGGVREKRPGHISRVLEGIRSSSTPADEVHAHGSSRSFVVNEFDNEDEEQEAYELAMIQDASTRSRVFKKQQKKKKKRKLHDARKILADAGLL